MRSNLAELGIQITETRSGDSRQIHITKGPSDYAENTVITVTTVTPDMGRSYSNDGCDGNDDKSGKQAGTLLGDGDRMSAVEVIRRVEILGGRLFVDEDGKLRVQAQEPLPQQLVDDIAADKPAIMVALGTPMNTVIHSVLGEICRSSRIASDGCPTIGSWHS